MLTSLQIERFGAFPSLQLDSLGKVNLIVGRNNVGKTMLLEAIRIYTANDTLAAIRKVLHDRDEIVLIRSRLSSDDDDDYLRPRIASLFNGRRITVGPAGRITIGPCDKHAETLWIEVVSLRRTQVREPVSAVQWEVIESDHAAEPGSFVVPGLFTGWGDASRTLIPFSELPRSRGWSTSELAAFAPSVSAQGLTDYELARWWDLIALREGEAQVIDCLRLISPIERLTMVEYPGNHGRRMPMVKVRGLSEPVPLKSLGDGMLRLFHLALAAESSGVISRAPRQPVMALEAVSELAEPVRPQPLLVDEIENGIHYATLPKVWKFLFEVAERHGIQIFATSHSWDCIEAFQVAAAETGKAGDARLIRIEAKNGGTKAIVFSGDELAMVTRDRIEVR